MSRFSVAIAFLLMCVAVSARESEHAWHDAEQLVLVTIADWNADQGMLRRFSKTKRGWEAVQSPIPVTIGRKGAAWGIGLHTEQPGPRKKEGDGRSPAGVFRVGNAFGYASSARTQLHYVSMTASDYCIDVASSPLYNRIVDERVVGPDAIGGSTEPMRRDIHLDGDHRYKLGFIIEHNSAGEAGAGSCIFAHIWKDVGVPTAGCTAMEEAAIRELIAWLDVDRKPIFVLLPHSEYERLQSDWHLPKIESGS